MLWEFSAHRIFKCFFDTSILSGSGIVTRDGLANRYYYLEFPEDMGRF